MKLEKTVRLAIFKKLQFKFVSIFLKVCTRAFSSIFLFFLCVLHASGLNVNSNRNPKTNAHFGNRKPSFFRKKNVHIGTTVTSS